MRGRFPALLALFILAGLLAFPAQATAGERQSSSRISYSGPVPLPEHGVMFGTFVRPDDHTGENRREAMLNFEALLGRTMAIERVYNLWADPFPTDDDLFARDLGRTLYVSWNASPRDGSGCTPWADIAAGLHDAEIDARAEMIKAYAAPLFFSFHHEPTTKPEFGGSCGDGDEYKAVWRRIRDRFEAAGVTNATYSLTMTAQSFDRDRGDEFYAGDDVIDVIAADGYNWNGCEFHPGPWREMDRIFQSFYDYGIAKGKPMVIAEYGSGEDDAIPGAKGQWFTNGADLMRRWPEIKGVTYFNVGTGGACDRYVDSSPSSLDAFKAMGAEPYFNPPVATAAVSVGDFAYAPKNVNIAQGTGVEWTFNGPSPHTVTDSRGMDLFDSGTKPAGSEYSFFFIGAGTYQYKCSIHPSMTGNVKVPILADPPSGGQGTVFTITWSVQQAPTGWAFDAQVRRPGDTEWKTWRELQTMGSAGYVPNKGPGDYRFRSRYHNTTNDMVSGWSTPVTVTVVP